MEKNEYNDDDYIDNLVDQFVTTRDQETKEILLECFDNYIRKYADIFCTNKCINLLNNDTRKFLGFFIVKEERENENKYPISAKKIINMFRRIFSDYTYDDFYHEVIIIFLEFLENYRPMIALHTAHKERIGFTHYIQVRIRFAIKELIRKKSRDATSSIQMEEFNESICYNMDNKEFNIPIEINMEWIYGETQSNYFSGLTNFERYLLWLKYESNPNGKELSLPLISEITGYHHKTLQYKYKNINNKVKLKVKRLTEYN